MVQKLIIFDFDGVLVDSFDQIWDLFKGLFEKHNFSGIPTKTAFRDLFLSNFYVATEKLGFDICHNPVLRNEVEQLLRYRYDPPVFSEIKDIVNKLSKKFILVIESSNYNEPLMRVLKKHGMNALFHNVIGADKEFSKTKRLKYCIETIKPEKVLFVTDTVGDIKEAQNVGISVIAVSWGYQSYQQLKKAQPFCVVRTPNELYKKIIEFFKNDRKNDEKMIEKMMKK